MATWRTFSRVLITGIVLIYLLALYGNLKWSLNVRMSARNIVSGGFSAMRMKPKARAREFKTCPYEMCYLGENGKINVHIISHSHVDPGWKKTVEEYYLNDVRHIMDTLFKAIKQDPNKRVIAVETIFFSYWWDEQPEQDKQAIRELVEEGRLEFMSGGWIVNDEAASHYSAIIDQHTLGFDFLSETFGECGVPKIGWQIDTFGHSREQASISAQFGYDGMFFARLDYEDYEKRLYANTLEHVWFGSDSLDDRSTLFMGIMYGMEYSSRKGFCFECEYLVKHLDKISAKTLAREFVTEAINQANHYTTNHIMWMLGSDFQFNGNFINFQKMDEILETLEKTKQLKDQVNAFYSTPSCYLYALNKANRTYTSKSDDFFPYAHRPHSYWTGYYTSRPSFKRYERSSNNLLQVCKQLNVFGGPTPRRRQMVEVLKKAVALMQHHDAISGTSKDYVFLDYSRILTNGVVNCQEVLNQAIRSLFVSNKSLPFGDIKFCNLLNVSNCPFTESSDNFGVILYNPLGRDISSYVRLPVSHVNFRVLSPELKLVESQMVPLSVATKNLPDRFQSNSSHDLVFQVDLPPLGYSTYFVETANREEKVSEKADHRGIFNFSVEFATIENEYLRLVFNTKTGHLVSIENLEKKIKMKAEQAMFYYKSFSSNIENIYKSGAYIFSPIGDAMQFPNKNSIKMSILKGPLVTEVRQKFSKWAKQVTRLYKGKRYFEIEWTVGPLQSGIEVISSFETSIDNNRIFFTDSNGRQMMKRMRDYRPTWDFNRSEQVAGNYYPVNSRIYIQEFYNILEHLYDYICVHTNKYSKDISKNIQLTILTDRCQGGSSIRNGRIELMLHRRTADDDGQGLDEPLDDSGLFGRSLIARGSHYVILDKVESSTSMHRSMAQYLYMSPYYGFFKLNQSPQEFVEQFDYKWSGLKSLLPDNVHILTLEEWHNGKVLLRLEHYFEKNEDPELSKPSTVSLKDLFSTLKVKSAEEYTLGANKPIGQAKRLQWNVQGYGKTPKDMDKFVTPFDQKTMKIELKSMQIRTFILTLE